MAKTYTNVATATAGNVYTAAAHNIIAEDVNNLFIPAAVSVYRSSNLTSYVNDAAISWEAEHYDTDGMWTSGSPTVITVGTTGFYHAHFQGQITGTATIGLVLPTIKRSGANIMNAYTVVSSGTNSRFSVSGVLSLTAADSLTATIFVSGGSAYSITGSATYGESQARLSLTWIGRTS